MRYLALIYGEEAAPADGEAIHAGHVAFNQEARPAGIAVGGDALQPTSTATTIRTVDGTTVVTDGPFAETKEQLGGFYVLEAADLDEALKWAAKIPHPNGCIEVRPILEIEM